MHMQLKILKTIVSFKPNLSFCYQWFMLAGPHARISGCNLLAGKLFCVKIGENWECVCVVVSRLWCCLCKNCFVWITGRGLSDRTDFKQGKLLFRSFWKFYLILPAELLQKRKLIHHWTALGSELSPLAAIFVFVLSNVQFPGPVVCQPSFSPQSEQFHRWLQLLPSLFSFTQTDSV